MTIVIPLAWALMMLAARLLDPLIVILVCATTMAAIVAARERQRMRELFRPTRRIAALSALAAVAMVATTYLIYPPLVRLVPSVDAAAAAIYASFLSRSLPFTIAGVVPVIVSEEVLWRGRFQDGAGKWRWIVTPLVYAAAHLPLGSPLLVVVALVCGIYWSVLRELSGSLIPSLCAHLVWDVALLMFPLVR